MRTWSYRVITTLLFFGLAACGGSGGGGGGGSGGSDIPTATNAAITPPPTTPLAISTTGGTTSMTNQSIAANAFQASDGALDDASTASGVVGPVTATSGSEAQRETLGAIVRRHAEKLKDHQSSVNQQGSVSSAVQVSTQPCSGGGTLTVAFDDASQTATEVFVNCNQGGVVTHGTLSSAHAGVFRSLGPTPGSSYTIVVSATFSIDLSVAITSPVSNAVTQGSFQMDAHFFGNMQAAANGGVEPGVPNQVLVDMNGPSLLASDGADRELLSNFSISVNDDDAQAKTTISGHYTYASTVIGGSVMVDISAPIVFQPQAASHPNSGDVTITSPGSPGKIVLHVISSTTSVTVNAFANANDPSPIETATLTWAEADAL
jgi:hypothetical protein